MDAGGVTTHNEGQGLELPWRLDFASVKVPDRPLPALPAEIVVMPRTPSLKPPDIFTVGLLGEYMETLVTVVLIKTVAIGNRFIYTARMPESASHVPLCMVKPKPCAEEVT